MAQPWFSDPNAFGALYGGIAGAVFGTVGGLLGAMAGIWAPRGKGRAFVLGAFQTLIGIGVLHFLIGLAAIISGQPMAIYYPFLLIGLVLTTVLGVNYPMLRKRYEEVDHRRIEAEAIRKG